MYIGKQAHYELQIRNKCNKMNKLWAVHHQLTFYILMKVIVRESL